MVEGDPELAPVDHLEREVMEVGVALLHEGEHVVVSVHVEPDSLVAEAVGDTHPQHLRIEARLRSEVASEKVRVTELAGTKAGKLGGRAGPRRARRPLDLSSGDELNAVPVGVGQAQSVAIRLVGHAQALEM